MATTIENSLISNGQEEEINTLREHFKDNIRILSSIGQFSYILKIRTDQYDVSITLQLDKSYPKKAPEIIITAPRLTPDQIFLVQQLLQTYSETLLNQPMILSIYSRLLKWFDENNIQPLNIINNNNTNTLNSSIPRSPTNGKFISSFLSMNKNSQNDEQQEKQISMKTAEDVLLHFEYDTNLDKRYFRIGYIDQYLGLQEKSFNDFDLTLPKNRIQYFKYINDIIWDKESRIDLIFGSTGNQQTLNDIIKRYENQIYQDDIHHQNLSTKPYLTVTDGLYKPNYFLSIPITNSSLISHYITYREHLVSLYPTIFSSSSTIDPDYLHLTLLTLRLENSIEIEHFIKILKRIQEEIHYHCSYPERICLEFHGLDTFHDKKLFIKCQENNRLENLRSLIIERLCEQKQKEKLSERFFAGNYQEFIPHIILFKNKRKFSLIDYQQTEKIFFGKQTIDALELSSINTNENQQQKYHCIFKLDLS